MSASRTGGVRPAERTPRAVWIIAFSLFALALVPRVANLGELSLYADDDLSALTAASVADGRGSVLPSGMEYRRALPFTWTNGQWIRLAADRSESSMRLPSALIGALTVPALFLLGRRWISLGAGLTAALLLGVSEWHLVFSRQARMYGPLLLFVVLATIGLWSWVRTGRTKPLIGGMSAALIAMTLHRLGILVVAAPIVWLAFPGAVAVSLPAIFLVAGVAAVAGWAIGEFFIAVPYAARSAPPIGAPLPSLEPTTVDSLGLLGVGFAAAGVILAAVIMRKVRRPADDQPGAHLRHGVAWVLALAAGLAAGNGQVYAFAVAGGLFFLLTRNGIQPIFRQAGPALCGLLALLAVHIVIWSAQIGLVEALKVGSSIPYPHAHTLVLQTPAPVILFGITALSLVLLPYRESSWGISAGAMLAVGMLAGLGLVREAGPTRYLLTAYPLMMLVAGAGLFSAARWVAERASARGWFPTRWSEITALTLSSLVVLSGVLGSHGIPDAWRVVTLRHGEPVNELLHIFGFRPDHRSAGEFVRDNRGEGDIVVAVDPLIQRWYAGPIDFWFRRYGDMRRYLRVVEGDQLRDIYVGSTALSDPAVLDSLANNHSARVWFITSGETAGRGQFYFSPPQLTWMDSLRAVREPAHVGEDGVTSVFCLNCP